MFYYDFFNYLRSNTEMWLIEYAVGKKDQCFA